MPLRGQYLRVLFMELQRYASHCVAIGTFGADVGTFFTPLLYPIRAKVNIGLLALTPSAFGPKAKRKVPEHIAVAAYEFTRAQKDILALANLANSVESVIGMIKS